MSNRTKTNKAVLASVPSFHGLEARATFDCVVIGGGHAGVEAAYACARIGAQTALISISKETIAQMSCNPAVGGLAKGQIVREIDALGGLMGLATDGTGIQFRMLNRSKGPAVQSPRAQADRGKYAEFMQQALEQTANLTIIESIATEIITEDGKVRAVGCKDGSVYQAKAVIVTTGTFLGGKLYIGSECLAGVMTERIERRQVPCWITDTNEKIHKLLRDNLHRAPLSSGEIKAADPRYCPSIESKVVRFADKSEHRIFLEPEEEDIKTIYCNGVFTSMPKDVQEQMLRLLPGTENARIIRYAYAIEYDCCPPIQLKSSLETKRIAGLFLAGQINGTSGYEEAAGQGIIAGINAARKIQDKEPIVLGRDQGYIGVLIDDLLTKEIDEPYRMFTSRAEYRLSLRADNADRRLTQIGKTVGLVDEKRWTRFQNKLEDINKLKSYLANTRSGGLSLLEQLQQPDNIIAQTLAEDPYVKKSQFSRDVLQAVIIDAKYEGYLAKQERLVAGFRALENKKIPLDLDYGNIVHLRAEAKEKLSGFRPGTLGQASRISGITPADVTVIRVHLKKYFH